MFRFQHSTHLYLLALLPVLVLLFAGMLWWRQKKLKQLGDSRLIQSQLLGLIAGRPITRFVLLLVAFTAAVFGWANLQRGSGTDTVETKGVDVIIALDVSKSMLAKDLQPDRLTRARQLVLSLLDKFRNDRVGLIVFAGRAYLQVPLTIDYGAVKLMLQQARPELVPTQGTVIGEAIDLATQSFSQREKKYKALVVISDGEDHDEQAISKAEEAAGTGIIIHTVGVGSPEGAPIFDPQTKSNKLDEQGNPVISKLNETSLKSIAAGGRGTYTLLRNANDAASHIAASIDNMEARSMGTVVFNNYDSYFQYFLIAALLALVAESMIPAASRYLKNQQA